MLKSYCRTMLNFSYHGRSSKQEFSEFFAIWLTMSIILAAFLLIGSGALFLPFFNTYYLKDLMPLNVPVFVVFSLIYIAFQSWSLVSFSLLSIRRLHDMNLSGGVFWLYVVLFFVLLLSNNVSNILFSFLIYGLFGGILVMIFNEGTKVTNRFGKTTKGSV